MEFWWQKKFEEDEQFLERFKKWEGKTEYKKNLYNELINLNCKSILNCGCGTGNDFITFRDLFEKNNIKVMGIEYSDFMIEEAKKNSLPVLKGNIKNISFDDNSFDSSIAIDVFEHLNELSIALNEMIRISKKKSYYQFF
jgi:ubiquinone/menaquinone biosynthesis C-methylase UbiE